MTINFYNDNLAKRFVSDYNLPIQNIDRDKFYYYLNLYEKEYKSLTKWNKLLDLIDSNFNSDAELFLKEYYNKRDEIIKYVENSIAYKLFNNMDMIAYSFKTKLNISKNNIYNEDNIGRRFLSIDLKKANFQALKFANSDIVLNSKTYEEFIHKFTDLDYIAESKYTRQVIFGKLNPKRHITVEKYIINKIYNLYVENYNIGNIVSMSNDEIVFEIENNDKVDIKELSQVIYKRTGINVHCEEFILYGIEMTTDSGNKRDMMYMKDIILPVKCKKYVCVPINYHAIVYKRLNNIPLCDIDYEFKYEGLNCRFCEDFNVKLIKNK